jgi:hypothetical protein
LRLQGEAISAGIDAVQASFIADQYVTEVANARLHGNMPVASRARGHGGEQ